MNIIIIANLEGELAKQIGGVTRPFKSPFFDSVENQGM
jgi:hypothetical protein